jgi:GT2 family glycosyltransferase
MQIDVEPRVAVVIVNFNAGGNLIRCLNAVVSQTRPPDLVVLVDNASSDGSIAAARELCPDVTLIQNEENLGFAAANNQAIALCAERGIDCAALLNPDAFAEPRWLEALLDAAQRMPGYASFASRLLRDGSEDVVDGLGDAYHVSGVAWRRQHGARLKQSWLRERDVFSACAGAALYSIAAVREVGGFDEDFFCYMEDVDLGFRLQLAGYRCRFVPDAVARHIGSATTGHRSAFSTYYGQRNLVLTYVKNMPTPLLWALLPLHVAANVAGLVVAAARGSLGPAWKGKVDAWRAIPSARAKRAAYLPLHGPGAARTAWRVFDKSLWPIVGGRP